MDERTFLDNYVRALTNSSHDLECDLSLWPPQQTFPDFNLETNTPFYRCIPKHTCLTIVSIAQR